jgi:hypothetical protein
MNQEQAVTVSAAPEPASLPREDLVGLAKHESAGLAKHESAGLAKQKPSKRYRPAGPPFHVMLYASTGQKLRVRLDVPAPDEECPLTLAPIAEDSLDFLSEHARWFPANPDVKKVTLPCGHSFGALNILYHFARRNMLCPCCRAGLEGRLTLPCIPLQFRNLMSSRVQAEVRRDEDEQIMADSALAAATLETFTVDVRYLPLHESGSIRMIVRFHGEFLNSFVAIDVPLERTPRSSGGNVRYRVPDGPYRTLLESQLCDDTVTHFSLSACMMGSSGRRMDLAASVVIPLQRDQNRVSRDVASVTGGSTFSYEMIHHNGSVSLQKLEWSSPVQLISREIVIINVSDMS